MSLEVHIDCRGQTHLVGRLHAAERGASVSFEYASDWLQRDDAFPIDPTRCRYSGARTTAQGSLERFRIAGLTSSF